MKKILLPLLFILVLHCMAVQALAAMAVRENEVWYRVHLGMGKGDFAVAPQKMREFIDAEVTPAFPNGFTITESRGQWQSSEFGLIRERTTVIDIQCADSDENWQVIESIANRYVERYKVARASVFIMRIPGITSTLVY